MILPRRFLQLGCDVDTVLAAVARLAVLSVMVQQVPSWDHGSDGVLLLTSTVRYVSCLDHSIETNLYL
jgi:hypothetical protein